MQTSRREFLKRVGAVSTLCAGSTSRVAGSASVPQKRHWLTLSFDDGFRRSFLRTAEIHEKLELSACLNVVAGDLPRDAYIQESPLGDFTLWNELQRRGHEIMPHGYRHANLTQLPLDRACELMQRSLDVFGERLDGFDPRNAVFNFPYNASSPELETWLSSRVRAFRTGGAAINPLPHPQLSRLTCTSFGPGNCEAALDREIERLLARDSGWLIFNAHGLDEEGWGPMRASYLEGLLERLLALGTVEILPAGKALERVAN